MLGVQQPTSDVFRSRNRSPFNPASSSYYRARYYDPAGGRFLSEDPIRFKANNVNFYEYAFNDPILYYDPKGLQQTVPVTPGGPVMPPPTPPNVPVGPIVGVGGAAGAGAAAGAGGATSTGAAAGGAGLGTTLAVGGLVLVDVGLAIYDVIQLNKLGQAYGWWRPSPSTAPPTQGCKKSDQECKKIKEQCIDDCLDQLGKGGPWNQGIPFRNCIRRCLHANGCEGYGNHW